MPEPHLCLRSLNGWYGESYVLHGVDLDVPEGETVTLLGLNGAGKTTTLRAVTGLLKRRDGAIRLKGRDLMGRDLMGRDLMGLAPYSAARAGLADVPEERGSFAGLSVKENLTLPPKRAPGGMSLADIYHLPPNLEERSASPGTKLSGGEQQMLAMTRMLRNGARLLLDAPTGGLAPVIVQRIGAVLRTLKAAGMTILLVEQNFRFRAARRSR